jgi:hypothetical protein
MTPQESIQPINDRRVNDHSYEPGRPEMGILQRAGGEHPAPGAREAKASTAAGESPWNIRMRFEIEPETQRVTVFIIDKQSQKVLRTIPPEKLETMQQGDLLELFI